MRGERNRVAARIVKLQPWRALAGVVRDSADILSLNFIDPETGEWREIRPDRISCARGRSYRCGSGRRRWIDAAAGNAGARKADGQRPAVGALEKPKTKRVCLA